MVVSVNFNLFYLDDWLINMILVDMVIVRVNVNQININKYMSMLTMLTL